MQLTRLSATEFTLVFSGAVLLLLLAYLLSFRRRTAVVAADPIWRRLVGRRRTPFRKLLALLLQALIALLFCLALGDPRFPAGGARPFVAQAMVLDASASMEMREGSATRFERMQELARQAIEAMGPRDRMLLISMEDSPRPLCEWTGDKARLRELVERLQPVPLPDDAPQAARFARSLLETADLPPQARRRLVMLSDRFHPLPEGPVEVETVQVAVGIGSENLSLGAMELRALRSGAAGAELFVEVVNRGKSARSARLSVHTPDNLLGSELLQLPAGGRLSRAWLLKGIAERRLMATLSSADMSGPADGFALDDRAFGLMPEPRARPFLLVTAGNLYLEKVLELYPGIQVRRLSPESLTPAALDGVQAAVFDGVCPASPVPALYFAPVPGPQCEWEMGPEEPLRQLQPLRGDHPVSRDLNLVDLQAAGARRIRPLPSDRELLADAAGPLILAREQDGLKRLAVGFDLARSDLPLRVAFPMMLHNALRWFLGEADEADEGPRVSGQVVDVPGTEPRRIRDPGGQVFRTFSLGGRQRFMPRSPGFYRLGEGRSEEIIPVNFFLAQESDPVGDRSDGPGRIRWQEGPPPPELVAGFDPAESQEAEPPWPRVLLAVVWLLFFDWVFFCFRILF